MRRSEITPELISLSKRAKKLGFPQDVEEGDWFAGQRYHPEKLDLILYGDGTWHPDNFHPAWLILSFSRCLEWLSGKGWILRSLVNESKLLEWYINIVNWKTKSLKMDDYDVRKSANTHHEAIAKAVVQVLEGEND
jgi:hypothetical protein